VSCETPYAPAPCSDHVSDEAELTLMRYMRGVFTLSSPDVTDQYDGNPAAMFASLAASTLALRLADHTSSVAEFITLEVAIRLAYLEYMEDHDKSLHTHRIKMDDFEMKWYITIKGDTGPGIFGMGSLLLDNDAAKRVAPNNGFVFRVNVNGVEALDSGVTFQFFYVVLADEHVMSR
jgi:hypothetical protein